MAPCASRRYVLLLIAAGIVLACVWVRHRCLHDPGVAFLAAQPDAPWVIYPHSPKLRNRRSALLDTRFRRTFQATSATLRWRAFRLCIVRVNGKKVATSPGEHGNWKQTFSVDLTPHLQAGDNELELAVYNDRGPGAIAATIIADDKTITTDRSWRASVAGSSWRSARPASDRYDNTTLTPDFPLPSTWQALKRNAGIPLLGGCAALLAVVVARRRRLELNDRWVNRGIVGVAVLWAALFINNTSVLSVTGFDAGDHLAYIQHILDHGQLPRAEQGLQMFQPPLYYLISAGLLTLCGLNTADAAALTVLRIESLLFALLHLGAIVAALRVLWPGQHARQLVGIAAGAFLPMHFYIFQYPTNEALGGALVSMSLCAALFTLRRDNAGKHFYILLGVCLGLAMLTRVTAVIGVVIILAAILAKRQWVGAAITAATGAATCGWYWFMIWQRHGRLLLTGYDQSTQPHWWLDEGYRTIDYYTHFGRCLTEPIFSSFGSFFDGAYSTLFGDGMVAGRSTFVINSVPWNMDAMIGGYLLAIPPACLMLFGAAVVLRRWVNKPDGSRFILLALPAATFAAMIYMSLKIPTHFGGSKAFYALGAMLPLCCFVAAAYNRTGSLIVVAILGAWCTNSYTTYWIDRDSPDVLVYQARQPLNQANAHKLIDKALQRDPKHGPARLIAARLMPASQAVDTLEQILGEGRRLPAAARWLASLYLAAGQTGAAERYYRQALTWNTDDGSAGYLYGKLLADTNRMEEAIQHYRDALHERFDDPKVHVDLAEAYARVGRASPADRHRRTARVLQQARPKP